MSVTLRQYLDASDEAERERLLDELILVEAMPVVRRVVGFRLRTCLSGGGSALLHPDAEDLCQEVIARLVRRVKILHASTDQSGIREFKQYASRVAANACNDYLRQKYPARARLKDRLRDLLERDPDFALWRSSDVLDEFHCGLRLWRELPVDVTRAERVRRLVDPEDWSAEPVPASWRTLPLNELVTELFRLADGPIQFETLLAVVATMGNVTSEVLVSFDEERVPETRYRAVASVESRLERQEMLSRVWQAVCELPLKQKTAFFFTFSDSSGDDLLALLMEMEVASAIEIARQMEMSVEQLMVMAKEMPLDNATLAVFLNTTRQNVNKWRFRAYGRLEEQLLTSRV